MTIELPDPIAGYFAAQGSGDYHEVSKCFAAAAIVHDEGGEIVGPDAIKVWMTEAKRKYRHHSVPTAVTHREDTIVVSAHVSGDFPGSPVTLDHAFRVANGKIVSLKIG